jgi:hypothetical protein
MSGFGNAVVGGASNLIRRAIRSPNYVPGVSGWTINKDGSAEFADLTIRGTFVGGNFTMSSAGLLVYSGTPAAGNLTVAISGTGGADSFGNTFPVGIQVVAADAVEPASSPVQGAVWHSRTSGFDASVSAGRFNYIYLPLTNAGAVVLDWNFNFTSTGPANGTNILSGGGAAITAPFRPLDGKYCDGRVDASSGDPAVLHTNPSGAVQFEGVNSAAQFTGQGIYFLDI